jgi:hypothetical protein
MLTRAPSVDPSSNRRNLVIRPKKVAHHRACDQIAIRQNGACLPSPRIRFDVVEFDLVRIGIPMLGTWPFTKS